jgi:hypothetical protein
METKQRECQKCKSKILNRIKVCGVTKNIKNRKYCLECSPWGQHNTRTPGVRADKNIVVMLSLYKRALQRKSDLIQLAGGCCADCGYVKKMRALSFHHLDRTTKVFGLSVNNLWSKPWDVILKEAAKCKLLCLNCHAEVEGERNDIIARVNAKYGTNFS